MINLVPELNHKKVNLEDFLHICKNKYNEGDKNFRLKNIIKGITKEGELGKSFFERNKTLVDLSTSLLPKKRKKRNKTINK